MSKINYKKMYEDLLFEKMTLQKEYDNYKKEIIENNKKNEKKINEFEHDISDLKEKLKKYTAPTRSKKFYENHKDEIIKKNLEYIKKNGTKSKPSTDKIKEYNKKSYEKRKLKKEQENNL
jgi:hypothetical protein